jgi:sporulation protein YlmC with PRC-barrel domain
MILKNGQKVFTDDCTSLGKLSRVVVDPITRRVSHIIVRQGFLFPEERVFPINLVRVSDEDQITVYDIEASFEDMPQFSEKFYIEVDDEEPGQKKDKKSLRTYFPYPPLYSGGLMHSYPVYTDRGYREKKVENIPEGTIAVEEYAAVFDMHGDHVGNLEQVLTDSISDRVTHLVIAEGLIFKERTLVPMEWVSKLEERSVHLAVGPKILETLPSMD